MSDSYFPAGQFARGPRRPVRRTDEEISGDYAALMARRQGNLQKYGGADLSNEEFAFLNDFGENPERYELNLTGEDFALINQAFPGEQNNTEYVNNRYRVATAVQLARLYDIPFHTAYSLEDDILASQYDERVRRDPKTAFKAVSDSFALGTNQKKLAGMGFQLMTLGDGEERDKLWAEIQAIKKENEKLGDGVTRNMFLEGLKGLGTSWAFTASSAAAGALGGLINPAVGVVSAAAVSSADMAGLEYVSLLDQGVDKDTARKTAIVSGTIQGVIEAVLGDVAALGAGTGIGQAVFKRLHYAGKIGAFARVVMGRAADMTLEGVEEAAQELASQAFTEIAKTETEKKTGVVLGRDTPEEKRRAIIESFKGGFLTAFVTGVPILIRDGAVTRKETQVIREAQINSPDIDTLRETLKDFSGFRGMTKETKEGVIQNLFDKGQEERARAGQARKAADTNTTRPVDPDMPSDLNPAPARRLDDGQLYYNIRTGDVEDGVAGAVMNVADSKTGIRYGQINYRVADNSLVIDRVNIASYLTDREEVTHDALVNLMAENKNIRDIVWETEDPFSMDMRDRIIRENPFGKSMQWFDPDMDVKETRSAAAVAGQIRKTFNLDEEQTRLASHIVYRTSRSLGFNPEDIIGRGLTLYTTEELKANPGLAELVSENNGLRKDAKGATFFTRDGETVGFNTVSREFEQGITGVIVAAENADLSTFVHEWLHFVDVAYIGRNSGMRRLFEEAVGKHYDEFTAGDRETLARSFEEYLKTGKTPRSKLRNLFERIAQALSSLVKGEGMKLSPELRRAFNGLFEDPESPLARAAAARDTAATRTETAGEETGTARTVENAGETAENISSMPQNVSETAENASGTASNASETAENISGTAPNANDANAVDDARTLYQTDADNREPTPEEITETKRQTDAVRRRYEGTDQWMKAPNGEATRLTERQWVQVRTPAFKAWFGDWEKLQRIELIQALQPEKYRPVQGVNKKQAEELFRKSEPIKKDFLEVSFPVNTVGKMYGIGGDKNLTLIPHIKKIFEDSIYAYNSNYTSTKKRADGSSHKSHNNIAGYHHFVNKIEFENEEYYIRFTVQELKQKKGKRGELHSGFLSEAYLYPKNMAGISPVTSGNSPGGKAQTPPYDSNLADFFNSVNPSEVSKSTDENGEPQVQTNAEGEPVFTNSITGQEKSAAGNAGTFSADTGDILFQLSDDEINAEARTFTTWREWMAYNETMDEEGLPVQVEEDGALSPEQKEAWYRNRWEQAMGVKRDENGGIAGHNEVLESEEINDRLIEKLRNEKGVLESFLERLYYYSRLTELDRQIETEEEAVNLEAASRLADRIGHQVHPTVILNAQRVANGGKLFPTARKQILTLMEQGAPWYRSLYADIMRDPEITALVENEEVTPPPIEEAKERGYSIVELTRIANRIKDKDIARRLKTGELNPGRELTEYLDRLDEQRADLDRERRKLEEELQREERMLSAAEKKIYEKNAAVKDLEKEIGEKEASVAKIQKRLDKAERDRIIDKIYSDERLRRERAKGKVAKDERDERVAEAKTRRDAIIASFSERVKNEYEELTRSREKLKALRKETAAAMRGVNKEAGEGAARDTALQKRLAVDDLKAQIRVKEAEKREIQKIREIKQKIFRSIMRGHGKGGMKNIWFENAEKIRAIQDAVNPKIQGTVIKWEGEKYTREEFRDKAIDIVDILPREMVRRLFKKTFDDWTIAELREFSAEIERLRYEGRKKWEIMEYNRRAENSITIERLEYELTGNPDYVAAAAAGSEERKQQIKKQWKQGIMGFLNTTFHFDRITDWMDGGKEDGKYTGLLIKEEREHYREKWNHIDERMANIISRQKELNIDIHGLYEKKHTITGIGPENSNATFTTAQLMGMYILLKNPDSRRHIVFGNLLNSQERGFYGAKGMKEIAEGIGRQKTGNLDRYVNDNLTENEKALARAIADDFKGENFQRMADVFANEYNQRLTNVNNYLPNMVTDATGSGESHEGQQKAELLNIGGFAVKRNPDKGMTVDRIKIGVAHQRAIELDIFKLHQNGVERAEHFMAYSRYIRKLNAVFRDGSKESRALQERIEQTFGKPVINRIKQEINVYANPQSFRDGSDKFLRGMRGNLGAAYLAVKTSSVLQQLATSPMPFLQEVGPHEMFASAWKYLTGPKAFTENIKNMSADMRHFSGDALFDLIHGMEEDNKIKRGVKKAQEIGMAGLEWSNSFPVFVGWNAVYEKSLKAGMTQEAAIEKANAVVRKTQPSGRPQDNAPLYRDTKEAVKLLTQFGTALNAIWQQVAYDIPMAIRRKQFGTALRIAGSYALAGTLAMIIKNGFSDDDDDEKKARRLIAWSFSQFSDSVPILGDLITAQVEAAVTGEKPRYFNSEVLPAAENLIKGAGYITRGDFRRGAGELAEGIALAAGLPVSGTKEAYEAISERNLERLLGYGRKKN